MQTKTETPITIDKLIAQLKALYDSRERITFKHSGYLEFKENLTQFIFLNHLDKTDEWNLIFENLVHTSNQYMIRREADIIILQLEKIKHIILQKENEVFWQYIHPIIKELIFVKFNSEQYADAVESAFKEINSRLKRICRKHFKPEKDLDGKNLMEYLFSLDTPRLTFEDITTDSGRNVQLGYKDMFSGAISGIRNPQAHENIILTKDDCIKRLIFASLLMDKIDEAINFCNITE